MTALSHPATAVAVTPIRVPLTAWMAVAIGFVTIYLMLSENGALLAASWETLHELFHDGRHALGVPCH